MFVIGVDDAEGWHQHVAAMLATGEFPGMRIKAPEPVDGSSVLHVIDPTGVLLVFVQ